MCLCCVFFLELFWSEFGHWYTQTGVLALKQSNQSARGAGHPFCCQAHTAIAMEIHPLRQTARVAARATRRTSPSKPGSEAHLPREQKTALNSTDRETLLFSPRCCSECAFVGLRAGRPALPAGKWREKTVENTAEGDTGDGLPWGFINKRPGNHGALCLTTGDDDQVGYAILTVWNSCELFADRYKQLLFLVMESN